MSGTASLFTECAEVFDKLEQSMTGNHKQGPIIAGRIPSRPIVMYLTKYPGASHMNYFAVLAAPSSPGARKSYIYVYADPSSHGYTVDKSGMRALASKVRDALRWIEARL